MTASPQNVKPYVWIIFPAVMKEMCDWVLWYLCCGLPWPVIMSVCSELHSVCWAAGRRSRGGTSSSSCRSSRSGERRLGYDGRFGWKGTNGTLREGGLQVEGRVRLDGVQCSHRMPGVCWNQRVKATVNHWETLWVIQPGPITDSKLDRCSGRCRLKHRNHGTTAESLLCRVVIGPETSGRLCSTQTATSHSSGQGPRCWCQWLFPVSHLLCF